MLLTVTTFIFCCSNAQNNLPAKSAKEDSNNTTDTVLVPLGGRVEGLPKGLEGKWFLKSGIKKTKPQINMHEKKLENEKIERENASASGLQTTPVTPTQSDNMHEPEKPNISFYGLNATFSGFTGCNHYSGRYHLKEGKLVLEAAAASTKMVCLGDYDETAFLHALNKTNGYRVKDGQLELLAGDKVLLVFTK